MTYHHWNNVFQIQDGRYDFFPVGKALALSSKDEDLTETKLDEITKNVEILLKAHQQQVNMHVFIKYLY